MAKPLGWVIVNEAHQFFAGYRHPGTQKTGHPVWVPGLRNTNFHGGHAAIYEDMKAAASIALSIFTRDQVRCGAKPIGLLGSDDDA